MKISSAQSEEAYKYGRRVFANSLSPSDAKKLLVAIGVKPNSAIHLVSNLVKMLKGHGYITSLSAPVFDNYLTWIFRDYGQSGLRKAISAVEGHIKEYESRKRTTLHDLSKVLDKHRMFVKDKIDDFISPEEISSAEKILEGRLKTITVNFYERSVKARSDCIEEHGILCAICKFDFSKTYGAIGKGFIHVHHLRDLASIGVEYKINPIEDLRPVCPNCHAMLHKRNPSYTILELKEIIAAQLA